MAAQPDRDAILAEGLVAHVGVVVDGRPLVIPLLYHHEAGIVYLHGSRASRMMRHLAATADVCLTVTIVDGLVASRSAFNHSANYRSIVVFGRSAEVRDEQRKRDVLAAMTARYFNGRCLGRDYEPATTKEMAITTLIAVTVEELSGKQRSGGPMSAIDALDDHPMWAGVVDLNGRGGAVPASPIN
ncbi:MAG TPA: pyridoxamine 5'-phosphate oxidase family protein [Candidatus Dormibacteraeota bacterium]|nr:pyridoxamine 5'-phosphate oxidase family protein [Candidatus Dormibacteraeota bacterium]